MTFSQSAPLSAQQTLWLGQPGAYGPRFVVTRALRLTGPVDEAALRGALDDVVARHEMLRTVVVRDTDPPVQQVRPAGPVRLEVRELPQIPGRTRDQVAEDQLAEAELASVPVEELPLLSAVLARFDERDSVLSLLTHHTACDGWSLHLIVRDLAAYYAARTGERPLTLPEPLQYSDYTAWQRANTTGEAAAENMEYWREQLKGAEVFTLPTDHPVPPVHTAPYQSCNFVLDAGTMAAAARLAKAARCSTFMVMLATFAVMAHRIRGTLEPVVNTMIHGRGQPQFHDTVGPFLNFLPLRTDLAGCESFRDVVTRTRNACLGAYAHEVPVHELEQDQPPFWAPIRDPSCCDFIFGYFEPPFPAAEDAARDPFRISERTAIIRRRERESEQMPGGAAWSLGLNPEGAADGYLQFSPEDFDPATAARWVAEYAGLVAAAVAEPERDWQTLWTRTPQEWGASS